jgi:hypothetical protein
VVYTPSLSGAVARSSYASAYASGVKVKFGSRSPPVHGLIAARIAAAWSSTPGISAMPTISSEYATSRFR